MQSKYLYPVDTYQFEDIRQTGRLYVDKTYLLNNKFYLYSIITHSTAIEGSTVTEVEAQLLFDEGITSSKRTMAEQMMNLDLKSAYEYGFEVRH